MALRNQMVELALETATPDTGSDAVTDSGAHRDTSRDPDNDFEDSMACVI